MQNAASTSSTSPPPPSTTSDSQQKGETTQSAPNSSRKRSTKRTGTSNKKRTAENATADIANAYGDASGSGNKTVDGSVGKDSNFAEGLVMNVRPELMPDVSLSGSVQPINPSLPSQLPSSLGGDSQLSGMIMTPIPFPPEGGSNFQSPIPFEVHPGAHQRCAQNGGGHREGEEGLEGMGCLERRYQHHPDFSVHEQQTKSYNIQAVVLRNS